MAARQWLPLPGSQPRAERRSDEAGERVVAVRWGKRPGEVGLVTHPGVYSLRTNETDRDPERLWRTYTRLTDIEAVFRSLKSELGLRPVYHSKPERAEGHLFITVIAYQLVQVIRRRLAGEGMNMSWATVRSIQAGQQRVTANFRRKDGRCLHVRKATQAEGPQREIYKGAGHRRSAGRGEEDGRVANCSTITPISHFQVIEI